MTENAMRLLFAILPIVAAALMAQPAQADPYKWCADYGSGGEDGGTNCYFMTLEQCRWAISGNGGSCRPNNFYDGIPVDAPQRRRPRRAPRG
jgi:hypothetical protein